MRHKLALTIALAGFCVMTALGVGMAGASPGQNPLVGTEGILPSAPLGATPAGPSCPREAEEGKETKKTEAQAQARKAESECPTPPGKGASEPESPSTTTPTAPSSEEAGGVHAGATIDGNATRGKGHKGAVHNQSIGGGRGGAANGGISFPSATGGGEQPPPKAPSGGQPFSSGGSPTPANPTTTIASFGPAPIGAPNFVIDSFQIPPFLLPIYQACGTQYGIPWEVLAAINKIETDFGSNLNVSSAGAEGWMQFLPSTWATYGRRRQRRRAQRPLQPRRCDLRRRQLPPRCRWQPRPLQGDPRLQPRQLVRAGGAAPPRGPTASCPKTWSAR